MSNINVKVTGPGQVGANVIGGVGPQGPPGPPGPVLVASVNNATGTVVLTSLSVSAASAVHTHTTSDVVGFEAAAAAAAPVQSVSGRTGVISLAVADVANAVSDSDARLSDARTPLAHTHAISEVTGLQSELDGKAAVGATNVSRVESLNGLTGVLSIAAGSNVTVSTSGSSITIAAGGGGDSLPAQSGNATRVLGTDGTAASWVTRYAVVDSVVVAGAGVSFAKDTAAGSITIAAAGGTSGIVVGSATPLPLGTAAAGTAGDASREDHVHAMPSAADVGAASAVHTHDAADVTDFATEAALYGPVSSVNGQTGTVTLVATDVSAASASHSHVAADVTDFVTEAAKVGPVSSVNGKTGTVTLVATDVSAASASHATQHMAGGSDLVLPVATSASITATVNNYSAPVGDILRLSSESTGTISITGLAGGSSGLVRLLANVSTNTIRIEHASTNSDSQNRFLVAGGTSLDLGENESAPAWYDATSQRWRVSRGAGSGVSSLNGLGGTLSITAGDNVTVSTAGSSITIAAAAGGGGGGGGPSDGSRSLLFLLR